MDLSKYVQDHDRSRPDQYRDYRWSHDRCSRNRQVERRYRDEGPNGDHNDANGRQDVRPDRSDGQNYSSSPSWQAVPSRNSQKQRNRQVPDNPPFMLLLVGVPGSGKSHFASQLEQAMPYKYVRVNQDTLGNRKRCEEKTRRVLARGKSPIIDRCNFDESQRSCFLDIARHYNVPVDCVVFDIPKDECIRRCENRRNHETISPGNARKVVECMVRQFSAPVEKFRTLTQVSNLDAVHELIIQYSNVR
jgi:predicted kinase